jgi:hypothetical protein
MIICARETQEQGNVDYGEGRSEETRFHCHTNDPGDDSVGAPKACASLDQIPHHAKGDNHIAQASAWRNVIQPGGLEHLGDLYRQARPEGVIIRLWQEHPKETELTPD